MLRENRASDSAFRHRKGSTDPSYRGGDALVPRIPLFFLPSRHASSPKPSLLLFPFLTGKGEKKTAASNPQLANLQKNDPRFPEPTPRFRHSTPPFSDVKVPFRNLKTRFRDLHSALSFYNKSVFPSRDRGRA